MELDANKSTSGSIPTKILQTLAKEISIPLTDCINTAILNGKFPDELKLADVFPVFKKENVFDKANYRPISLLPSLSKIYAKIIYKQLNSFFNNKLSPLLCGFRSQCGIQHALLNMIRKWQTCPDASGVVGTLLMDLSKAFYCLPHDLIIAKLHAYGIEEDSLKLIYSYLTNRKQRTRIGSKFGSRLDILLGVPQGSILGPLIFNIFVNL